MLDDTNGIELEKVAAQRPDLIVAVYSALERSEYDKLSQLAPVVTRILEELGFEFPDALSQATKGGFGGQLSAERTELLDLGALVWFAEPPGERKIKRSPVYSRLSVREQGRDVFIAESDHAYDATSFVSVLSMPTLMEELVPRLARAADGDPKTSTDQLSTK